MAAKSSVWSGSRAARAIKASRAKEDGGSDLNLGGGEGRVSGIVCTTMWLASVLPKAGYS